MNCLLPTSPSIAIIGAGVSGLRCADLLTRAGCRVTILEARSRIGGRVHQIMTGSHSVDAGSNWIHGTNGNPIMDLANRTHTQILKRQERTTIFDTCGKQFSEARSDQTSGDMWDWIQRGLKYSAENSNTIDKDLSLMDWLKTQWADTYRGDPQRIEDLVEQSRFWGQIVGSPIEQQSLKFLWLEDGVDGDDVFVASTYQRIFDEISRPAIERAEIRLNTEVKHIQYRETQDNRPVRVETHNDGSEDYDEVVVTCPLGWLKKHSSTAFTPCLPKPLLQAIENIGFGALEKLYITFPEAFWLDNNNKDSHPCFTRFLNPTGYHPHLLSSGTKTDSWTQSTVSLAHLPGDLAHPTLLFYMTGDVGTYITSRIVNVEPHSKDYDMILAEFAEPLYSLLPNYNKADIRCQPISFYQTAWQKDPHAGFGSYSTYRTGLEHADLDIETMRDTGGLGRLGKGLWLAGEHTAPFVALGTTTGAFWSGERVARNIINRYRLTCEPDELEYADTQAIADSVNATVNTE